jgi:cytochrome b6-f complex iron-sulfur subunit
MKSGNHRHAANPARRLLLLLGSLLLLYPLIRFIRFKVPRKPKIVEVSGTVKQGGQLLKQDFILFSRDDELWAASRICTHLGCRLNYKEREGYLECPCHQSRFSIHGEVLNGPAEQRLPLYQVEQKGAPPALFVTIK